MSTYIGVEGEGGGEPQSSGLQLNSLIFKVNEIAYKEALLYSNCHTM